MRIAGGERWRSFARVDEANGSVDGGKFEVRTFDLLRRENAAGAKEKIFGTLEPFLRGGHGLPSQEEVAARLKMSVATLRSHLSRLRARYREVIRGEVSRTVAATEDVDEELRHLFRALVART